MRFETTVRTVTRLEGVTLNLTPKELDIIFASVGNTSPMSARQTLARYQRGEDVEDQDVYDLYGELKEAVEILKDADYA